MAYEGLGFELVELEPGGDRCTLYTFRFDRSDRTEFEKWARDENVRTHDEFSSVYSTVRNIPDEGIPDGYYFKQEKYDEYGWVTPFVKDEYHAELRLYCIKKPGHEWVIVGNGCVKPDGGSLQKFPQCELAFDNIVYVEKRVRRRMRSDTSTPRLHSRGQDLIGNLDFPPESV